MSGANDDPVALCRAGRIGPEVACARLLLAGTAPDALAALLATDPAFRSVAGADLGSLRRMLADADVTHDGATTPDAIAAMFDRASAVSPEGSVALYSLGDPAVLARATAELVDWLRREHLVGFDDDVLDLGCGIGRVAVALAPFVRSVRGLDVSAAMVAEATSRAGDAQLAPDRVRFEQTGGHDLRREATGRYDVVLAVDSFPYLAAAGTAAAHLADLGRLLRPGGRGVILNLRYGGDAAEDDEWRSLAPVVAAHGLAPVLGGVRPFALWDGRAFTLRRKG